MRISIALLLFAMALPAAGQGGGPVSHPAAKWQRFVAPDGKFSVSFPGTPTVTREVRRTDQGHPFHYAQYSVDLGWTSVGLSTADYEPGTRITIDGAADGIVTAFKDARNVRRQRITMDGRPAIALDFDTQGSHFAAHVVADGSRLYELAVVEPNAAPHSTAAIEFMGSFSIR